VFPNVPTVVKLQLMTGIRDASQHLGRSSSAPLIMSVAETSCSKSIRVLLFPYQRADNPAPPGSRVRLMKSSDIST
ncbi:hypothetical protein M378DRAFT_156700, partial [Amanita muscaria Koide BX008]